MADDKHQPVEHDTPKKGTWVDFFYNKKKGELLGRTGASWAKILLYFVIYYACLCGFFAGCLHAFYATLPKDMPNYYGKDSLLLDNPALGIRPMPLFDSTLIRFDPMHKSSYTPYVDHLIAFLKTYGNATGSVDCGNDQRDKEKACIFDAFSLLDSINCGENRDFGFLEGEPCVVVKMNKLIGFFPDTYKNLTELEADLKNTTDEIDGDEELPRHLSYAAGNVGISCEGSNVIDKGLIKSVRMSPETGIPEVYFPYMNQQGYRSPFVIFKFRVQPRTLVQVTCRVWAKNIDNTDGQEKRGATHFEILVE